MAERMICKLVLASSILALAGCGDKTPDSAPATQTASVPKVSGWNAADACSIIDKAAASAILKQEVSSTQLGLVHEASGAEAATSECAYLGADGAAVARLMTRSSPIDDNTPATIAAARAATTASLKAFGSSATVEDVPGLGKSAFVVARLSQLNVFIDNARMIVVSVEKVPDGASGEDIAIALAKKAGA